MIVGEPGTGKEYTAQLIHRMSHRSAGPFLPVDCAALQQETIEIDLFGHESITWQGIDIRRGVFEEAHGGTLLLNDIASLPHSAQMKIMRATEQRCVRRIGGEQDIPIDVRVIATLNEPPERLLQQEVLRKELFYSISPITIEIPPLRNRRGDVPGLIEIFLVDLRIRNGGGEFAFSPEAVHLCSEYEWPGNVRLLRNAVEYATVMSAGAIVQPEHLPAYVTKKGLRGPPPEAQ
jgi:DNA-binding NtrC family response regulator